MVNPNVLTVAMNGETVGEWLKYSDGRIEFQYAETWLAFPRSRAISLSLPLSQTPHKGDVVYNFFDN